jgi:hypothetical protein
VSEECRIRAIGPSRTSSGYALRARQLLLPAFAGVILPLALGWGERGDSVSLTRSCCVTLADRRGRSHRRGRSNALAAGLPYLCFVRPNETTAFTGMAAFSSGDQLRVEVDGQVEQVFGQVTSGRYFDVLGLQPAAGRLMTIDDEGGQSGRRHWRLLAPALRRRTRRDRSWAFRDRLHTVELPEVLGLTPGRQLDAVSDGTDRAMIADATRWLTSSHARSADTSRTQRKRARCSVLYRDIRAADRTGPPHRTDAGVRASTVCEHASPRVPDTVAGGLLLACVNLITCCSSRAVTIVGSHRLATGVLRAGSSGNC